MSLFRTFKFKIDAVIRDMQLDGKLPHSVKADKFTVEPPRDEKFGDISTNVAMVLAKHTAMKPYDLAQEFCTYFQKIDGVDKVEVAGAGFINLYVSRSLWHREITECLHSTLNYGSNKIGDGKRVNIEYVSANPTGPLHVGHVRGAVFGDALANLMVYSGYKVIKEYYINDAGTQVDVLAQSAYLRYLQAVGEDITEIPQGLYPGEYLVPVGKALCVHYGTELKSMPSEVRHDICKKFAIDAMMALIKSDLALLNIQHDIFTSEQQLVQSGAVDNVLSYLSHLGLIYQGTLEPPKGKPVDDWEEREQTLFKAKQYGDDSDRPIKKSDGTYTYFATDIAYHYDKYKRGADLLINVWGADHGGYVKRIQAAVKAISDNKADLIVRLCQIVHLFKDGQPYKMSKRAGTFVTLRDVLDEVGADIVRFIMLTRKNDAGLDFDFSKVTEQSKDNPVFYVQYAYARIQSVFEKAKSEISDFDSVHLYDADFSILTDDAEINLIKKMAQFPRLIEQATESAEPHRIAFYLQDLASLFHALWHKGSEDKNLRFVISDNNVASYARLAMIRAVSLVIEASLKILGVQVLTQM
jgi:arginyl-tRNA synthetase